MRLLTLLLVIGFSLPPKSFAQALIVEFSDSQSEYPRLPDFLRALHRLRSDFLAREPKGKLILVVNGDFSGASRYATDQGKLGYAALASLAPHWEIVMTIGNHEAFDWGGSHGSHLFLEQIRGFQASVEGRTGRPFRLLAANLVPGEDARDLFVAYQDIEMASGEKLRFVGLLLERFFRTSAYDPDRGPRIIESVGDMGRAVIPILRHAAESDIKQVVLVAHDRTERVRNLTEQLHAWLGSRANRPKVTIPFAFSAHDHARTSEIAGQTLIINGGSRFEFATIELDANGRRKMGPNFYPRERQRAIGTPPPILSVPGSAIRQATQFLRQHQAERSQVVVETGGFEARNHTLTRHRLLLGTAIADSMRIWTATFLAETNSELLENSMGILAFFNSSAYRRDTPIPAGNFTLEMLRTIQPVPARGFGIFQVSGATAQALYTEVRRRQDREGIYTPQISGNLHERSGYNLEVDSPNGTMRLRDLEGPFVLVVDSTLRLNEYSLPIWRRFLQSPEGRDFHGEPEVDSVSALRQSLAFCEQFVRGDGEKIP